MPLIETAVSRRTTVAVGVILVALFGTLALRAIPVQLAPEVAQPEITVTTRWPGASPQEVEREIVRRQEDQLKSVQGVVEMKSESADSQGTVILTFRTGEDMDAALLKVSNRLNQVRSVPADADRPVLTTVNTGDTPIAWFVLKALPGNPRDIRTYQTYAEDVVKARLERVPGVAQANVFGGREMELQLVVDPARLAGLGLTLPSLIQALDRENVNATAGTYDEGKRQYLVRVLGELDSPEAVESVVLLTPSGSRISVGDVARAQVDYKKPGAAVRQKGEPALVANCLRESGANVLEVMAGIREALAELNAGPLAAEGLSAEQVYDETEYIDSAIDLVVSNLYIGGGLAVLVLLVFLRALSPTLIIALAIPVSVIGTFIVMYGAGRSLNVISLAGMAFAVGMVVDNGIVVLENIYRHMQLGEPRGRAAVTGTREVWGAVLASTLTTMAVFLPILFIQEETGQLFRDIAIAITAAVGLSLVVSVTVIPAASVRLLHAVSLQESRFGPRALFGLLPLVGRANDFLAGVVYFLCGHFAWKALTVLVLTSASLLMAWQLAPKAEYLPEGNRNLVIGILLPPPGYNVQEFEEIGKSLEASFAPLWEAEGDHPGLPGPAIRHFFYVARGRQIFMGASTQDPLRVRDLVPVMQAELRKVPGMIAVVRQTSLFSRGLTAGRSVDLEFSGDELEALIRAGGAAFGAISQAIPGSQIRPIPSLDLGNPEVQVIPDRIRLAELGFSARELGVIVDALLDGAKASDVLVEGTEVDLTVTGHATSVNRLQDLETLLLRSPGGRTVTLGSVAQILLTSGPEQINRVERQRTIALQIIPPETVPLEAALETIEATVERMRESGAVPEGVRTRMAGTADKLTTTFRVLRADFLLAIIITYLLMASLFESFFYPFVILFSVPLAAGGGFLGLWLVNRYLAAQPLDMLTMLGFIILVGTVVNNAILVVHQTLLSMRHDGTAPREALRDSVRTRIRPIFMSTATTVFGMLPLVLFPGAGSELYRGIGAVVVGGLALSTVFTLFLVPTVMSLFLDLAKLFRKAPA
ncbi:MAG: efflux RND transporter permease subunit [Thermodesulfobacteriota bacterium]